MANVNTDQYLESNRQYAGGKAIHKPAYPCEPAIRQTLTASIRSERDPIN
jgi:hypothetical protein